MTLQKLFLDSALEFPDNKCILYGDPDIREIYGYRDIKELAEQVACELLKLTGGKKFYVIISLRTATETPIIILGTLISSCGFFYVDPDDDVNYLISIAKRLKAAVIITSEKLDTPELTENGSMFLWDEELFFWKLDEEEEMEADFAYAIQTSGTTGEKKMVQVTHQSIISNILQLRKIFDVKDVDAILLYSPLTFDPSLVEIFLAFSTGSTLCIPSKRVRLRSNLILDFIRQSKVTLIQITPSLFRSWTNEVKIKLLHHDSSLKTLVLGGEEFPSLEEINSWGLKEVSKVKIFNVYGITELSCWSTCCEVWSCLHNRREFLKYIGKPLEGTQLRLELLEDSEGERIGELYVGSSTRICLIDQEKYCEIIKMGSVFRATGDIFKEIDGSFYFIRRKKDSLFKRWGLSVNCRTVEQIALRYDKIRSCHAVTLQVDSEWKLGLFVIILPSEFTDFEIWLQNQRKSFPKGHWPDVVLPIENLPLTAHGKMDKRYLIEILKDKFNIIPNCTMEFSEVEKEFVRLWKFFTGAVEVNSETTFTTSGGDSISALQLVAHFGLKAQTITLGLLLGGATFSECLKSLKLISDEPSQPSTLNPVRKKLKPNETDPFVNGITTMLKGRKNTNISRALPIKENSETKKMEIFWMHDLKKCVDASPLGVVLHRNNEEFVIIGSHSGLVLVIKADLGEVISEVNLGDRVESSACLSSSTDNYYIGCYDGCVYSINIYSGEIFWRYQTGDAVKTTCCLINGKIFFGSYDKHMYCLTEKNDLVWRTSLTSAILSQIISFEEDIFVCGISGGVWSLNRGTGEILWFIETSSIFTNPLLLDDTKKSSRKLLLITPVLGGLRVIEPISGTEVKSVNFNGHIFSSPIISPDRELILVLSDETLHVLESKTYKGWKINLDCRAVASPVFLAGTSSEVLIPSTDGKLNLVNVRSRTVRVILDLKKDIFSSPVAFPSGLIVFGCRDNNVYCLKRETAVI